MVLYRFYHEDGEFILDIEASPELVERLLEEYKSIEPYYDDFGFLEFLIARGIKATYPRIYEIPF